MPILELDGGLGIAICFRYFGFLRLLKSDSEKWSWHIRKFSTLVLGFKRQISIQDFLTMGLRGKRKNFFAFWPGVADLKNTFWHKGYLQLYATLQEDNDTTAVPSLFNWPDMIENCKRRFMEAFRNELNGKDLPLILEAYILCTSYPNYIILKSFVSFLQRTWNKR